MSYITRTCAVDGCATVGQTRRSMCRVHYNHWRRSASPEERRTRTPQELFASKTVRDERTGCLMWTGALDPNGYGRVGVERHTQFAHRVSLAWKLGRALLPGMDACHTCDTPGCVEPEHLFEGTHQQNVDDATGKQRHAWGARNGHAKLTETQVRAIRATAASGQTQRGIAERYGVGQTAISRIVSRERWALAD